METATQWQTQATLNQNENQRVEITRNDNSESSHDKMDFTWNYRSHPRYLEIGMKCMIITYGTFNLIQYVARVSTKMGKKNEIVKTYKPN